MKNFLFTACLLSALLASAETPKDAMKRARALRDADFKNYAADGSIAAYSHDNLLAAEKAYAEVVAMTNATNLEKIEALCRMAELRLDAERDEKGAEACFVRAILLPGLKPEEEAKAEFNRADWWRRKGDCAGALYQYGRFMANTNAARNVRTQALDGALRTHADRDGWEAAFAWAEKDTPEELRDYARLADYAVKAKLADAAERFLDRHIAAMKPLPNGRYRGFPGQQVAGYLGLRGDEGYAAFEKAAEKYVALELKYDPSYADRLIPEFVYDRYWSWARRPVAADPRYLGYVEGLIAKIDPKKAPGKDRLFEFCARAGRPSDAARYAKEVVADAAAFPTGVVRRAAVALALEAAGEDGEKAVKGLKEVFAAQHVTDGNEQAELLKGAIEDAMHRTPKRFAVAEALYRLREDAFARPEPKRTVCRFVKDAPQGAAALVASRLWADAKKELFDRSYGDSLKTLIASDVSVATRGFTEYKGEKFQFSEMMTFCDADGVKILIRTHATPEELQPVRDGYAEPTGFEAFLAFDDEGPYQQFFTTRRRAGVYDTFVTQYENGNGWRRPCSKENRMSCERIILADGVATLFSASWKSVFAHLPEDGDFWRFECFDWQRGGWSWSGTRDVHGRSGWGALVFAGLDAQAKSAIRRRLLPSVREAVQDARNPDKAGVLDHWKDPELGDRDFYLKRLKPLEDELAAGAKRISATMSDAEVDEVWNAIGVKALNLAYIVSAARADYLAEKRTAGSGDGEAVLLPLVPQPREWKPSAAPGYRIADGKVDLALGGDAQLGDEGYEMTITASGVRVRAHAAAGLERAKATLAQFAAVQGTIPAGTIRDWPKYRVRGLMLDVGRKFVRMETLRAMLKDLAYYKMNEFHIHLNDDGAHQFTGKDGYSAFRLECTTFPGLTAKDGFYTKDEFRAFMKEAAAMGVTVIPEIDTPAHAGCFIKLNPSFEGKYGKTHFDLKNPAVRTFMEKLFAEYCDGPDPVFVGKAVHVGTDEYDKRESEAFRAYTDWAFRMIRRHGKEPRAWGALTHADGQTPVLADERIVMDIWHNPYYQPLKALEAGYSIISIPDATHYIVPAAGYYFDYLDCDELYESWEPNVIANVTIPENHPRLLGGKFAIWNDLTGNGISEDDIFERAFPSIQTLAQKMWSGKVAGESYAAFRRIAAKLGEAPGVNLADRLTGEGGTVGKGDVAVGWTQGGYEVSFGLTVGRRDQVLFDDGTSQVRVFKDGRIGFSRDGYDWAFEAKAAPGVRTELVFRGDAKGVSLVQDGTIVGDTRELMRNCAGQNGKRRDYREVRTLHFPLVQKPIAGRIDDFRVKVGK